MADRLSEVSLALTHRGPDDRGFLQWTPGSEARTGRTPVAQKACLAFIHRRLSIIDPGPNGWQPMSSIDGRYHVVYNGEVYNYPEVRSELHNSWAFRSNSDTEVVLAALATWGPRALTRFIGMFAFAFLDTHEQSVMVARDHFGIKPLFYCNHGSSFYFASDTPSLLLLSRMPAKADPAGVYDYLRYGLTDHRPGTLVAGVSQVPAGHYAVVTRETQDAPAFHRFAIDRPPIQNRSVENAASTLRELVLNSVALHLRSDVPVGFCLSGGIDSSTLICAAREAGGPNVDLVAISYFADEDPIDESRWARQAAERAGAQIIPVRIAPDDFAHDMGSLIRAQGEPFMSSSVYAQYRVFAAAHEAGLKVMLDGQGADELFAGYPILVAYRVASLLSQGKLRQAFRLARSAGKFGGETVRRQMMRIIGAFLPRVLAEPGVIGGRVAMPPYLASRWFAERGVAGYLKIGGRGPAFLHSKLQDAVELASIPRILRFEDRNSMAWSVESRVPFLIPELYGFAASLPEELLVTNNGEPKAILRTAMRGLVPDSILNRTDKVAFQTPTSWLGQSMGGWAQATLTPARLESIRAIAAPTVLRMADNDDVNRNAEVLWRCATLVHWAETYDVEF
jgi:asparagine synthase (glutamine-hydrolysing)